ncbi:MAG: right-handed parallel beta-helix repeat-containing protein, partial [Kiritimatiellae bacterium]|nr:right-handed parallel beta-helix repeat-containing protein [Kiritimatiellia bacterium]
MHSKVSFFKKPVLIGWLLVAAIGAQAATYYVSTKGNDANDGTSLALAKQTIQAGINVAANGDTVLVAHGRYGRIYIPPGITVRSVNGPGSTKIDGGGVRRCAYLDTGAVLDGFTVWNGFSSYGGGVDVWGGTVRNCMITRNIGYLYGGAFLMYGTMENCTISGNSAGSVGGGVYAYSSTVRNCTIIGNIATYWGAGAYLLHSTVENCTISGNSAGSVGGGVYVRGGTLRNCTIDKNIANVDGGGTYLLYSTVENSTIIENIAYRDGGGVYADSSTVRNCTISENIAYLNGGGSYLRFGTVENCMISGNTSYGSAPTINYDCGGGVFVLAGTVRNCAITGNIAYWDGGGAFLMGGTMENCTINGNYAMSFGGGVRIIFGTVKNCLISGNTADDIGGGVHAERGRMENCTISGNTVTSSGGTGVGGGVYVNGGTVRNCIAYYNQDTDAIGLISYSCIGVGMNITGVGNIINEPQFVSTGTGYGTNHVSGDYHLRPTSPCINIGTNQSWMTNAVDLDGLPRIFNGVVDMGAYECVGSAIMRNPMILSNRCDYGSNATWQTFEVWNAGTGAMAYALSPNVDWLSLSPASGTSTGETDLVGVNYGSAGLALGCYTGIVTITSAEASNSPQVVTVYLWVDKLDQMITFPPIASQPVTGRVGLAVTASSGLPVSFTVASGPGVISGETNLSFLAAGTVWVVASQAGNSIWEAATPVTNAVIVTTPPVGEIRFAETNVVVNEDVVNVELRVVRMNGSYGAV